MKTRRRNRIRFTADESSSFVLMFEPSGMSYQLDGGETMFADVIDASRADIEIVHWEGGISIWTSRGVVTRDATGQELHRLN